MRKIVALIAITLFTAGTATAQADADKSTCHDKHAAISFDEMIQRIDGLGYDLRRLTAIDGFFQVQIVERESRGVVEATFSAKTGELTRASVVY